MNLGPMKKEDREEMVKAGEEMGEGLMSMWLGMMKGMMKNKIFLSLFIGGIIMTLGVTGLIVYVILRLVG